MQKRGRSAACLGSLLALTCTAVPIAAQPCLLDDPTRLAAPDAESGDGAGISVAIDGDVVVVGASLDDAGGLFDAGSAYVYRRQAGTWAFEARLGDPDAADYDLFGRSVAVSGDVILVGAEFGDGDGPFSDTGTARVFRFDGSTWIDEGRLTPSERMPGDAFGVAVALDGDLALVGARYGDGTGPFSDTGVVYAFRHDGSAWSQEARWVASDAASFDAFGSAVALDGGLAVVGAEFGDGGGPFSDTGTAYVFRFDGSTWQEEARLVAPDATSGDSFGSAVGVDGDRAVVGAVFEDDEAASIFDRGAAYVYRFDGLTWSLEQKLTASDAASGHQLGGAVALEDDWLVAGARYGGGMPFTATGAVHVFFRLPSQPAPWVEEAKLADPFGQFLDELGASVAMDAGTVVVGAPFSTVSGDLFQTGSAFVFDSFSDCDADGILDSCQDDCNLNGIRDSCELAAGTVDDDNLNDVPDVCECGCLDLFLLIDNTATMAPSIATIQAELPDLVERARARSVGDLRLGLIRFGDRVDVLHDLTFDTEEVLASLATIGSTNGGDLPEPSDAALQELFEKDVDLECLEDATAQYPEELDPAIDFRSDCLKIAVLLTDALPTGCEDGPPSAADLANAEEQAQNAAAAGVQIFAIYPPNPTDFVGGDVQGDPLPTAVQIREIMQRYAEVSGGIFAEVATDGRGLLDAVLEGLDRCVDCNDNDVSDFTDIADGTSLDQDGDTRPDECVTGACCTASCTAKGDPATALLACLTGEAPFALSCQETTRALCDAQHEIDPLTFGTFQGIGSDCATSGCGGACCLDEGCVSASDEAACDARGGAYQGDGTSCAQPGVCGRGACCSSGGTACEDDVSFALCQTKHEGSWLGPGALCEDQEDRCLGACCTLGDDQALCQQTTRFVCEEILSGHFSGEGSDCDADDFTGCEGACCESSEACVVTSYEECLQAELTFAGPGTICGQDDTCPDYGGCWIAGTCQVSSRLDCQSLAGSYLGAGRACGENCAPPPGSCLGDLDLDGDIDEDDRLYLEESLDVASTCIYGVGDCACDRFDLCQSQTYDPECSLAYLAEHLGTVCP